MSTYMLYKKKWLSDTRSYIISLYCSTGMNRRQDNIIIMKNEWLLRDTLRRKKRARKMRLARVVIIYHYDNIIYIYIITIYAYRTTVFILLTSRPWPLKTRRDHNFTWHIIIIIQFNLIFFSLRPLIFIL